MLSGDSDADTGDHLRRLGIEERVVFLGPIPEGDLPSLYRGAAATLLSPEDPGAWSHSMERIAEMLGDGKGEEPCEGVGAVLRQAMEERGQ